jgi:hypothetical protein
LVLQCKAASFWSLSFFNESVPSEQLCSDG